MLLPLLPKLFPPPHPVLPTEENNINIDWGSVLYVVFDLETTGRSRQRDKIIELAAVILDESGVEIEDFSVCEAKKHHTTLYHQVNFHHQ
jgi:DNA polymerase III alpha subunit (gram-positive type)